MRIFLIGYMGAGKTTLGKVLACKMGYVFVDTDLAIENRYRQPISDLFASQGEERFRMIEHKILEEVILQEHTVIATGG